MIWINKVRLICGQMYVYGQFFYNMDFSSWILHSLVKAPFKSSVGDKVSIIRKLVSVQLQVLAYTCTEAPFLKYLSAQISRHWNDICSRVWRIPGTRNCNFFGGIGKILYWEKVSEPVSDKFGTEKSTDIGIENICYRKKVSVSFSILGNVTHWSEAKLKSIISSGTGVTMSFSSCWLNLLSPK